MRGTIMIGLRERSPLETTQRALYLLVILSLCTTSIGCYRFTVRPENTQIVEYHGKTVHSYGWNLIDEDPIIEAYNCGEKGLYAARAKTNLGFIAVAALTFGAWVPMRMEWRCVE
jgi:hypothetical protein